MACVNGDQDNRDYKTLVKELKKRRKKSPGALFEDDEKEFSLNPRDLPGVSNIKDLNERPIEWVRPEVSVSLHWHQTRFFLMLLLPKMYFHL